MTMSVAEQKSTESYGAVQSKGLGRFNWYYLARSTGCPVRARPHRTGQRKTHMQFLKP
jgi:hypothetical protein